MDAGLGDGSSYRPADFVPYPAEAWFSLVERFGESVWPLHVAAMLGGLALPLLIRAGRGRIALVVLAAAWSWVGWAFLLQRYAVLNWAGGLLGGLFIAQAVIVLALAAAWPRVRAPRPANAAHRFLALATVAVGLVGVPLITGLAAGSAFRAETFALHPDPTAIASVGILAFALRPAAMAVALALPAGWCALAAVHLRVLDAAWWPIPAVAAAAAIAAPLVGVRYRRD
jgi:hypothetical protein